MSLEKLARKDLWKTAGYKSAGYVEQPTLRLNCNENPWAPDGTQEPLINRYPEKQPATLVQRLSELYEVSAGSLLITRGADDGIDALIRSFCLPAVDSIAQCSPAFVMYEFFARLQAVAVHDVPLNPDNGFSVDFEQLAATNDAKIYFLCTPNNPTGSLVDLEKLLSFSDQVKDRSLVVVDEAYIEFASTESLCRTAVERPNIVVLRTLSKAWSLAGARMGVLISNPALIEYLKATTSPYPLSRASVNCALQATEPDKLKVALARIELLNQQREQLRVALLKMNFVKTVYASEANFLLVKVNDASALMKFTNERGVLIRDQSGQPGLQDHVRISVGTEAEMIKLIEILTDFCTGESKE